MAEVPAEKSVNYNFDTTPESALKDRFWYYTQAMFAAGSFNDYDRLELVEKDHRDGRVNDLRLPLKLTSDGKPQFTLFKDSYEAFRKEVSYFMQSTEADEQTLELYTQELAIIMAIGEYQFKKVIFDPRYPRIPRRMNAIMDMLTNKSDMSEFLFSYLEGCPREDVLRFMGAHFDDKAVMAINGLRVGMTICRSYLAESNIPYLMTDEFVVVAAEALLAQARQHGPLYVKLGEYFKDNGARSGASTFAYLLPEWLVASALPLPPKKFLHLLSDGWKA